MIFLSIDDRIPCSDPVYGTTSFNTTATIACMGSEGDMRRQCGFNGTYGNELNFCLIPEISNLREVGTVKNFYHV